MNRLGTLLIVLLIAASVGACSLGSGLSTGSVLGGAQANAGAAAVPPPLTANDRAVQVAATSARAERCGFNFNPDKLRDTFLAAEVAIPGAPADLPKQYDVTRKSVIAAIVQDEGYCTEGRTKVIKGDLVRHLAGDFSPPQRKAGPVVAGGGWFDNSAGYRQRETINPEILDDPKAKRTRRIDE